MSGASAAALHVDLALLGLHAADPAGAFARIADALRGGGLIASAGDVCSALCERESTASTALGRGVALPHARVSGLARSIVAVVRLTQPLSFGAPDGAPVDLLFVVLSPAGEPGEHVRLLARLARRLQDPVALSRVRTASDPEHVRSAIDEE